jgi:hypothetical protein
MQKAHNNNLTAETGVISVHRNSQASRTGSIME